MHKLYFILKFRQTAPQTIVKQEIEGEMLFLWLEQCDAFLKYWNVAILFFNVQIMWANYEWRARAREMT